VLTQLLQLDDEHAAYEGLTSLSQLATCGAACRQAILQAEVLSLVVDLLLSYDWAAEHALTLLSSLAAGSSSARRQVADALSESLLELLQLTGQVVAYDGGGLGRCTGGRVWLEVVKRHIYLVIRSY
jgi:hypothetical protein